MQAIQSAPALPLVTPVGRRRVVTRQLLVADAFVLCVSSLIAYWARSAFGSSGVLDPLANEIPIAIAVIPLWLTILYAVGAYSPFHLAAGIAGIRRFLTGATMSVVGLGFISFAANLQLSRVYVALLFASVVVGGVGVRTAARASLRRGWRRGVGVQRTLIVGVNEETLAVADAMRRDRDSGYAVAGFLDERLAVGSQVLDGIKVIGNLDGDAASAARLHGAGLVVVAPSAVEPGTLRRLTVGLEGSEIDLAIAPSLFEVVTRRLTVEAIGNVPLLQVEQVRLEGFRAATKRAIDVVSALILLALLWPVMTIAAIAIRLDSPGPTLFRQARVGKDSRPFTILKFRTMTADAESRFGDVADLNEAGHHFFKIRRDPRVTRVGSALRKWSIDELPQLWNVLRGDMSMVGPRPPLPSEASRYEDWHLRRLRVRPGITGLWQVSGRSNVNFDEAVRLDIFYIENWSVGLDAAIILRTVRAVLGRDGAY